MIISFNNHWPNSVDHYWNHNLPLNPEVCIYEVSNWLVKLRLPKNEMHKVVMPGVREGLVLTAYHAVMGHFPIVIYSKRNYKDGSFSWQEFNLQQWRDKARQNR